MRLPSLDIADLDRALVKLADVVAASSVDAGEKRVLRCLYADLVCSAHRENLEVEAFDRKRASDAADSRLVAVASLDVAVGGLSGRVDYGEARRVNEKKSLGEIAREIDRHDSPLE